PRRLLVLASWLDANSCHPPRPVVLVSRCPSALRPALVSPQRLIREIVRLEEHRRLPRQANASADVELTTRGDVDVRLRRRPNDLEVLIREVVTTTQRHPPVLVEQSDVRRVARLTRQTRLRAFAAWQRRRRRRTRVVQVHAKPLGQSRQKRQVLLP